MSTEIGRKKDAKGNPLPGRKRSQLGRLRREHKRGRWRSKRERNLAHGLGEVRRVASGLDLGESVREQACRLFRSAQEADLLPGRSIDSMAAASVYGAIRCNGLSWTLADVGKFAGCDQSALRNAYTVLNAELELPAQPMRPSEFVARFASDLDLPDRIRRRARELANRAQQAGIVGGAQPTGFAAACLYEAVQDHDYHTTQAEIADVADTTPATIRTHWKTVREEIVEG